MTGRIRPDSIIWQDFSSKRWPIKKEDVDLIFTITPSPAGKFWECRAVGYGEPEAYGNGPISTIDLNTIEVIGREPVCVHGPCHACLFKHGCRRTEAIINKISTALSTALKPFIGTNLIGDGRQGEIDALKCAFEQHCNNDFTAGDLRKMGIEIPPTVADGTVGSLNVSVGPSGDHDKVLVNLSWGKRSFNVGDVLRMRKKAGGYRIWMVEGIHLGGEKQEGTYHLRAIDIEENAEIHIPCIILETHPEIERR